MRIFLFFGCHLSFGSLHVTLRVLAQTAEGNLASYGKNCSQWEGTTDKELSDSMTALSLLGKDPWEWNIFSSWTREHYCLLLGWVVIEQKWKRRNKIATIFWFFSFFLAHHWPFLGIAREMRWPIKDGRGYRGKAMWGHRGKMAVSKTRRKAGLASFCQFDTS